MLKEKLKGAVVGLLIGATLSGGVAMAVNTATWYDVVVDGIKIVLDGKQLNPTDANGNSVEPIIYNGTTYLPVRALSNAFGKAVYWDGPNYTVYLGDMNGKLEYPSQYLTENNIGAKFNKADQKKLTDNYENTYSNGLYFFGNGTAEYLVNMKYSKLKGTLYVPKGENSTLSGQMKVIADNKVIYTSPIINKTSKPVYFDINIRGYNHIKLEFENGDAWENWFNVYVGDAGFYQ